MTDNIGTHPRNPSMSSPQYVVAIETSSRNGSICLGSGDAVLEARLFTPGNRHAAELMPALEELCRLHGCEPRHIAHIYLSLGPGSFTGIRIAISIARALHLATGAALVGVPTLDVIAANAPAEVRDVIVMLDAKRGQVFAGQYRRGAEGMASVRGPVLIEPGRMVDEALAGGLERIWVMGEGVGYHRRALARATEVDAAFWVPSAATVYAIGRRMAAAGRFTPAGELLPNYIRLAEAEEVWRKRHGVATLD